jgi:amino acid transporter
MGVTIFARAFLQSSGLAREVGWYPLALAACAVIGLLALRGIRPTTRALIVFELVSVLLILALMVTIVVRLLAGTPAVSGRSGVSAQVFSLPPGAGGATLALAATSGFLAFAGFESAGSLGEESVLPTLWGRRGPGNDRGTHRHRSRDVLRERRRVGGLDRRRLGLLHDRRPVL